MSIELDQMYGVIIVSNKKGTTRELMVSKKIDLRSIYKFFKGPHVSVAEQFRPLLIKYKNLEDFAIDLLEKDAISVNQNFMIVAIGLTKQDLEKHLKKRYKLELTRV